VAPPQDSKFEKVVNLGGFFFEGENEPIRTKFATLMYIGVCFCVPNLEMGTGAPGISKIVQICVVMCGYIS